VGYLNRAEPAVACRFECITVAEGWNVNVIVPGDFQNSLACLGLDFLSIDGERYHRLPFPPDV
jgi:hypothetical protein